MSHEFDKESMQKAVVANRKWYKQRLMNVLLQAKEKRARDIDVSIEMAGQLMDILNSPVAKPIPVAPRVVEKSSEVDIMKPVEPELLDVLMKAREGGANERYLRERFKKGPQDKFYLRECTSWDYGWQQQQCRVPARDVNHGMRQILHETIYRTRNIAPDPPHYAQPSGADTGICGEYQCSI